MAEQVFAIFPKHLREAFLQGNIKTDELEEIRIRIGQPLIFRMREGEFYFHMEQGRLSRDGRLSYVVTRSDIQAILNFLSRYSIYAYKEELRSGFITLEGGHRVGLAGQVVMENGQVAQMNHISFLNIRIAHQCIGCAKAIYPYLLKEGHVCNTLIVSPVGIGKTTCLRDCIRLLSGDATSRQAYRIGVVDERSEIAACYQGVPQNDLGIRTDVMDRCDKSQGMLMLLRSMAPDVIAVDELGSRRDFEAVERILHSGCSILGTVHASDMADLEQKAHLKPWLAGQIFDRFILLKRNATGNRVYEIYDGALKRLC